MSEEGRTYRKCVRCVHGKKSLENDKVCTPCIIKKKNNFRDRGKEWPMVEIGHVGEVGPLTRIHIYREPVAQVMADLEKRKAA